MIRVMVCLPGGGGVIRVIRGAVKQSEEMLDSIDEREIRTEIR